jgi:hypothetical protein
MSTIDSPEIIRNILLNNGVYIDEDGDRDPQARTVYAYFSPLKNDWVWYVSYNSAPLLESLVVMGPTVLWTSESGFTDAGHQELETLRKLCRGEAA